MRQSLRFRLLTLILISFVTGWSIISGFAWWRASAQADRLFDIQLSQLADLLAVVTTHEAGEADLHQFAADLHQSSVKSQPLFQVWSADGQLLIRGPRAPDLPLSGVTTRGYSDEILDDERYRVYTRFTPGDGHRIQVAQEVASRQMQLHVFVRGSLTPLLLALPMIGLLWLAVERALTPLKQLAAEIGARTPDNLNPIYDGNIPSEVFSLVQAINALFGRLQISLKKFSRFSADAAHELRTPLAGSITQIHAALDTTDVRERQASLQQALHGLSRLHRLMEQLLTLARLEPDAAELTFSHFDLNALAVDVAAEHAPRALQKGVSLEIAAPGPVNFYGVREMISIVLRNLLDNAIRSTPSGGEILLSLLPLEGTIRLQVEDSGGGIPDPQKRLVLERFHRLPGTSGKGSGLGLSIVLSAVELHQGTLLLNDRESGPGLRVIIDLPIHTKRWL